jgi:DNA mismatch endonuclease (patch repair protein)
VQKLERNKDRDRRVQAELKGLGWSILKVWECEIRDDIGSVIDNISSFLGRYEQQ